MVYEELDPEGAYHRQREGWRYIDVRTEQEFAQGHPEGAVNVPIFFMGPAGMQPNPGFLSVVQRLFPTDTPLLVGCRSGGRSARACELLASKGYRQLVNIAGGVSGSATVAGWRQQGLPWSTQLEGVSYRALTSG
ncbi:MAG TPA: rhodanese-like domain-containing protein [Deltaproteobacteria bacterium]|nr:rhodanese-like domain-containing protein [Deltaproteobacteria bacterium]